MIIRQIDVFPEGKGRYYKLIRDNGEESFVYGEEEIIDVVKEAKEEIELAEGRGIVHPIELVELVNAQNKLMEVKS